MIVCYAQVLPFATEATLSTLEANVANVPPVTEMLHAGETPIAITDRLLHGLGRASGATSLRPRCVHALYNICMRPCQG